MRQRKFPDKDAWNVWSNSIISTGSLKELGSEGKKEKDLGGGTNKHDHDNGEASL